MPTSSGHGTQVTAGRISYQPWSGRNREAHSLTMTRTPPNPFLGHPQFGATGVSRQDPAVCAISTYRQNAFTKRICSTDRQLIASSFGLPTTIVIA